MAASSLLPFSKNCHCILCASGDSECTLNSQNFGLATHVFINIHQTGSERYQDAVSCFIFIHNTIIATTNVMFTSWWQLYIHVQYTLYTINVLVLLSDAFHKFHERNDFSFNNFLLSNYFCTFMVIEKSNRFILLILK